MKKQNKYFAKKVKVGDIEFSSQKEANRYCELRLLERAGKISDLQLQVPFVLIPAQYVEETVYTPKTHKEKKVKKLIERELKYICDFAYYDENGNYVVEDVKGYKEGGAYQIFKIKKKLMLSVYGIKIVEV